MSGPNMLHELPDVIAVRSGITLESLRPEDTAALVQLRLANAALLVPEGIVTLGDEPADVEETLTGALEDVAEGKLKAYVIRSADLPIGEVHVEQHEGTSHMPTITALWLEAAAHRQGTGLGVVRALARSIFGRSRAPFINGYICDDNEAAVGLARKLRAERVPAVVPESMRELNFDLWRLMRGD